MDFIKLKGKEHLLVSKIYIFKHFHTYEVKHELQPLDVLFPRIKIK